MTDPTVAEFFPTPPDVIRKLVAPVYDQVRRGFVLEPSAGKGDILDYLKETMQVSQDHLYAIEANPELQYVLAGKGYRVLDSDFLAFNEPYHVDVILMNPPFSNGVDHALKAWEVVAPGGTVVCLLNAETLRNTYTAKRQLLASLVSTSGHSTDLGRAFAGSARDTDVDVVMIVLHKPEAARLGYMDGVDFETEAAPDEAQFGASPLAHRDTLEALVAQYNAAVRLTLERREIERQFDFYMRGVVSRPAERQPLNVELAEIKAAFWGYIFERTRLGSVATSQFRAEFEQMRQHNASMAFTVDNVMALLHILMDNRDDIVTRCIVDVFDKVTALHEKNTVHVEGWKTNKAHRINRKIIVPWGVSYDRFGWSFAHYSGLIDAAYQK